MAPLQLALAPLGIRFAIGGSAFTIINLLFGFGVLTPASN